MPELTEQQKKQYNTYRAEGMPPERALSLATKGADNQFNPAIETGIDNILFGKKSLTSAIGSGIKEAVVGGVRTIREDQANYGNGFAALKSPLSLVAGVGRGAGEIIGGVLETADDLIGESVSGFGEPYVEAAVNSDVGQYLINKGIELDQKGRGIPSDILDTLNLTGIGAVVKTGAATSIKNSILNSAKAVIETGAKTTARTGSSLTDFFKKPAVGISPQATTIEVNLGNIEKILSEKLDQEVLVKSLDDIRDALKTSNNGQFADDVLVRLDELLKKETNVDNSTTNNFTIEQLTPDEKEAMRKALNDIEDVLKQEDAPSVVEEYLTGIKNRVDDAAAGGVGIIEGLSDNFIEGAMKTIENVRAVPEAISVRAKQAIDRRIVRVAKSDPAQASENILDLYKKAVVPGVKKKNKTIANIEKIDESIKRAVPELAKKYEVEDLQDFAAAISLEKKAIFAEIEKGLEAAGEAGKVVDMTPIVKELDELLASERAEFSQPLRNAIARARKELVSEVDGVETIKSISPTGAQDLIADLNAQLQSYYRGSTSGTAADVTVDTLVVNNLRQSVDDIVDDLGEGSFAELKSRYADLKRMEDDVVHRAVFEAQKGSGLSGLTDISSAGDFAAGALSPAFLAKGVAQFFTKEVLKSLSDKDELVRQMFLYGKNLDSI